MWFATTTVTIFQYVQGGQGPARTEVVQKTCLNQEAKYVMLNTSSLPAFQPFSPPALQPSSRPAFQPFSPPALQPSSLPAFQAFQPSSSPAFQLSSLPAFQLSSFPASLPARQPSSPPAFQPKPAAKSLQFVSRLPVSIKRIWALSRLHYQLQRANGKSGKHMAQLRFTNTRFRLETSELQGSFQSGAAAPVWGLVSRSLAPFQQDLQGRVPDTIFFHMLPTPSILHPKLRANLVQALAASSAMRTQLICRPKEPKRAALEQSGLVCRLDFLKPPVVLACRGRGRTVSACICKIHIYIYMHILYV